jgi:hypothetical protein
MDTRSGTTLSRIFSGTVELGVQLQNREDGDSLHLA